MTRQHIIVIVFEEYGPQKCWNNPPTPPGSFRKITQQTAVDLKLNPATVSLKLIQKVGTKRVLPLMLFQRNTRGAATARKSHMSSPGSPGTHPQTCEITHPPLHCRRHAVSDPKLKRGQTQDQSAQTAHILGPPKQPAQGKVITVELKLLMFKVHTALRAAEHNRQAFPLVSTILPLGRGE